MPELHDESGEPDYFIGVIEDITERKAAEAELKVSMERFRVLFDASADPYLILDGETFRDCNQAAVDLLRYGDKQDLLVRSPGELSPERQPDGESSKGKAEAMINLAYARGSHRFDWVHCTKDGEELPVEVTLKPIELAGKNVLLAVWHDLTVRKQQQEAIEQRERELNELIETAPFAIAVNRTQEEGFAIEHLNQRFVDLFGWTMEESPDFTTFFPKIYPNPEYRQWVLE